MVIHYLLIRSNCRGNLDIAIASKASTSDIGHIPFIRVTITLVDINDNDPTFHLDSIATSGRIHSDHVVLEVPESTLPGTSLALPTADDLDSGPNGRLQFHFETNCSKKLEFRSPYENQPKDSDEALSDDVIEGEVLEMFTDTHIVYSLLTKIFAIRHSK